jgi:kynureninase
MLPPHIDLVMVESADGGVTVPEEQIVEAIDGRTLFAVVSHVLFRSATILNLEPIIRKAQAVGAQVIVDGYHAGGIIPVDVEALGADYYLGGVLKWMCGGPGGVFLHARQDHLKTARPGLTGWMAHQRPFDFEVDEIALRDDAFRFLNGTPHIPNLYSVQPGVEIIGQVGVDNIRRKSLRQTALIIERAAAAGWPISTVSEPERRGGTVTVNPPHAYEISRELIARDILIDYRVGAGIRISPHFYNTDAEIHRALNAIIDILESGAWRQHAGPRDRIT